MNTVSPLPSATITSAKVTTGRIPNRSISAAANGEIRPNSIMFTDTAKPIIACDQPNSMCSGSISTPGTDRNAADPTRVTKVTAATTHAQCSPAGAAGPASVASGGAARGRAALVGRAESRPVHAVIVPETGGRRPVAESPICARIRP